MMRLIWTGIVYWRIPWEKISTILNRKYFLINICGLRFLKICLFNLEKVGRKMIMILFVLILITTWQLSSSTTKKFFVTKKLKL